MKSQSNTLIKDTESKALEFTATVLSDGSLSIPEALSELLRLSPGKTLPITFENGEAKILTPQERGRRVQERVAEYMRVNNIPPAQDTGAERIRKMRDEDVAIEEAKRGW
jgi:antitoxin component of MazEF toxin-antitoxin module